MKTTAFVGALFLAPCLAASWGQEGTATLPPPPAYEIRKNHDPNGIGKFYLGREIAHVMGPGGIPWLDRPERETEEKPAKLIEALELKPTDIVADVGAGSGYYSFRIAPKLDKGKVLAVDIEPKMLEVIRLKAAELKISNVELIQNTEKDCKLPEKGVDLALMVDVYHEFAYPCEMLSSIVKSLKPGGRAVFVEFRKEDPKVPIKEVHKMSVEQVRKEMDVVGLKWVKTVETLPWQHIIIGEKQK